MNLRSVASFLAYEALMLAVYVTIAWLTFWLAPDQVWVFVGGSFAGIILAEMGA